MSLLCVISSLYIATCLPDEHVDGGDRHVSIDRLPRLGQTVQLAGVEWTSRVRGQCAGKERLADGLGADDGGSLAALHRRRSVRRHRLDDRLQVLVMWSSRRDRGRVLATRGTAAGQRRAASPAHCATHRSTIFESIQFITNIISIYEYLMQSYNDVRKLPTSLGMSGFSGTHKKQQSVKFLILYYISNYYTATLAI